jgi:metal-responsive CopG/Arc/MetJ family transcriptional regulator
VKTAISIPDPIFDEADELAKRLGVSRSELYSKAVENYLGEHRREGVTEALNRVYAEQASELDPVLAALQSASLSRDEW